VTTTAPARATTGGRRDPLLTGIRVLLGLFGAFKLYGTVWFTFFATAEQGGDPQGVVDWLVAAWSFALAVALIVAAFRLGAGSPRTALVTSALLVVEVAFSFVKLFVYDEPEAVGFMAVDVVLLALLAVAARRR
jgi:hypothetical protein